MAMLPLLLLALFQAPPAAPVAGGEPLRSGCSADDRQISVIGAADRVHVDMALAGESQTCYKVILGRAGESLTGYVLGESLPAVAEFVRRREKISQESAEAEARRARMVVPKAAATTSADPAKPADPLVSTQFEDFSGRDANGKRFSLSGLNARVTVVTFWSPASKRSIGQLESVMPLYNQFHASGLAAVGVSMDPHATRVFEALDDITIPFSQIPDQSGLASHYQIDPRAGKTLVLDASHRIVAAGPMGPEIVKAVRQLLGNPESQ